jgi:protein MpaA
MSITFRWQEFPQAFAAAAEAAGFVATRLLETPAGPLHGWKRAAPGFRVYLSAGIHGDEPAGPLALLDLMVGNFFTPDIDWTICPALNPTGLAAGTRDNAEGIDLNRDYLKTRTLEVAAHHRWLALQPQPDLFLSLHEDWETRGFYLYEINLGRDEPPRARAILDAVRPWFHPEDAAEIDGHTPREPGWIFHPAEPDLPEGWPEAIHMANLGCPLSFTFETPSRADLRDRVAAHCAAVRAACAKRFGGNEPPLGSAILNKGLIP